MPFGIKNLEGKLMKKSNPQAAFPVLLVVVFVMVFCSPVAKLFGNLLIGRLLTELSNTKISSLSGVNSGVYVTTENEPDPNTCDWRYGWPYKMHWPQLPDFGTTGMDIDSSQAIVADDFKCTSTGPISDIHFWASFVNDILPANGTNSLSFEIKIYSDIPATTKTWSMPGKVLWNRTFNPGDYTVRKIINRPSDWYDPISFRNMPDNHRQAFQYNFCIQSNPFIQEEGTIYWLSIREVRTTNAIHKLGWKTTTKKLRWNDDAVLTLPGASSWIEMTYPKGHDFSGQSIDLAFVITDGQQGDRLHDLGDAPDSSNTYPGSSMLAYSDANTIANYPTIFWTYFPPYGPIHWQPEKWFYLGKDVTFESGADSGYDEDINNNLYPPGDLSDRDGADDGIKLPLVLPNCGKAKIPFTVTFVSPVGTNPIYLNVWCDWNRDGDWDDILKCSDNNNAPEWAVQNAAITINSVGTVDLETPAFTCWHPQNQEKPSPMWLRITISDKPSSTAYPSLIGSGGSGPDEGYEYGETEDYFIYPRLNPDTTQYDWGDAIDSYTYPAYPTISSNNGAHHVIAGPWLGDANDNPDAELDGQPDANSLGDDLDTEPLFSLGIPKDDENGATIPPLIPGYPADITLEVGGGGGIVQAWIDYDSNLAWETDEMVYNNFLAPGSHVISFVVPADALPGQTFARFRISRNGGLNPSGQAKDGEVEDYEVFIESMSPYTKWLQLPDVTPNGIDIQVDSNDGELRVIADDFECTSTERITDVHFWGSWKNDKVGEILRIQLSIYGDDPVGSSGSEPNNPYSRPDPKILWQKDFYKGQFSQKLYHVVRKPGEWWADPVKNIIIEGADRQIWRIDIDIDPNEAFLQSGTVEKPRIYWLAIRVDTNDGEFGWKTRRWPDHFMDDAVWDAGSELPRLWNELRYPKKHPYFDVERNSIDMAFQLTFMHDQGLPTMRPVSLTQCPAVQTKCPTTATQCPPVNTRCPTAATKCPPVQTQCAAITVCGGSSATICPAVYTQCPVKETQCPATVTNCVAITVCGGSSETICPAVQTQCPVVETSCPFVETQCYAITVCQGSSETICPALQTQCPVVDTKCPPADTKCPVEETKCPFVETKCYAITVCGGSSETICPALQTQCPVVNTECPPSETACPAVTTNCPPTDTRCPAESTRCPPVETQCPECQITIYPAVETRCPVVSTECPASETKCPSSQTKCPAEQTKCPVVATQCPSYETRCPAVTSVCPPVPTQCTAVDTECPPVQTKCPQVDTKCPECVATVYPQVETRCPEEQTKCPPVQTQCPPNQCDPVVTVYPPVETKCPVAITTCPVYDTWCNNVQTKCPYNYTQCPIDPTGQCQKPPIPPWEGGGTNGMTYSSQTIAGETNKPIVVPVIQSCPAIDVKAPTAIEDAKLMIKMI
jgi:hypothetical protein